MAGRRGDRVHHLLQIFPFVLDIHSDLENRIVLAVGKPGPVPLATGLDDLRVVFAHVGVQQHRGAHPIFVQRVDHPPNADAHAIVAPAII